MTLLGMVWGFPACLPVYIGVATNTPLPPRLVCTMYSIMFAPDIAVNEGLMSLNLYRYRLASDVALGFTDSLFREAYHLSCKFFIGFSAVRVVYIWAVVASWFVKSRCRRCDSRFRLLFSCQALL